MLIISTQCRQLYWNISVIVSLSTDNENTLPVSSSRAAR